MRDREEFQENRQDEGQGKNYSAIDARFQEFFDDN